MEEKYNSSNSGAFYIEMSMNYYREREKYSKFFTVLMEPKKILSSGTNNETNIFLNSILFPKHEIKFCRITL
jgi:hypothetical protein